MINISEVGARCSTLPDGTFTASFGVYLPGITPANNYQVVVKVIHSSDRFNSAIPTTDFNMVHQAGSALDLWSLTVNLAPAAGTHFGTAGTYLYRYQLLQNQGGINQIVTLWFTDPFAWRTDDVGELSAFLTPGVEAPFVWTDAAYKTRELDSIIAYELHVEEFNDSFDGVATRLDYLASLGVNLVELMPVSSLKLDFDWGYGPLHYFAVNERWGGPLGLKRLVDACHARGIAVILDVVYQHTDPTFPYELVYSNAGIASPMMGTVGNYGPQIDYSQTFAQDYVGAINAYLLSEYHVDGFRYDEVTDLYVSPTDTGYAKLAYDTYNLSLTIPRFQGPGGYSRIVQVAEALGKAITVLNNTYTAAVWQDDLLNKSESMAQYNYLDDNFAHILDPYFQGYPATKTVTDLAGNSVQLPVAPFQYVESHDHSQLICFVAESNDVVPFGDRSQFYKLQPYAIALYTCQGVPMLFQGQEVANNWSLPGSGNVRVVIRRDMHWEYFYDVTGSTLVNLYRRLGNLRTTYPSLRSRESYYFNLQANLGAETIAYRRHAPATAVTPEQTAMVFLNFSNSPCQLTVPFSQAGTYREMLDDSFRVARGQPSLEIVIANVNDTATVTVPSNYGAIFITV